MTERRLQFQGPHIGTGGGNLMNHWRESALQRQTPALSHGKHAQSGFGRAQLKAGGPMMCAVALPLNLGRVAVNAIAHTPADSLD